MAKIDANGQWYDLGGADEQRLLPNATEIDVLLISFQDGDKISWGTTTKTELLSEIEERIEAIESTFNNVETTLDQIITGA